MRGRVNAIRTFKGLVADLRFKKCSERFFSEFLENCILSCESFISLQHRTESSLRHCRIKKGKETHSFPNRNPFLLYSLLFYWLSGRYKILKSFSGVVGCNKHLCLFLALTQRCSSQDCGIATLGKLHQLANKHLLLGCRRNVMQYLILLRSVNSDVLGSSEIANLCIKVCLWALAYWLQVISWLSISPRGTI